MHQYWQSLFNSNLEVCSLLAISHILLCIHCLVLRSLPKLSKPVSVVSDALYMWIFINEYPETLRYEPTLELSPKDILRRDKPHAPLHCNGGHMKRMGECILIFRL